jgi:TonB family protein
MKIVCDACQAKYSISDDKVQGKVFKIRCKKCSNIIVVRGGAGAAEAAPATQEKDTRVYDYGYDGGGGGAQAPAGDDAVWHLVINQDQVGPLSVAEVQQKFASGEIDGETFTWREGFADWLPLAQVDAFAALVASGSRTAALGGGGGGAAAVSAMFGGDDGGTVKSDAGDLFAAAASSGSSRHAAPADDDGGDLFGSKPASASAQAASAGNSKLRGERNENSVLFSLNNLAQLASDKPAMAAAPSPSSAGHATGAAGGEGSGLIDIRSMASAYLGGSGAATSKPASAGVGSIDDLPVFGGGGFSEPAVIVPTARPSGNNKILYVMIGAVGLLAVAAVIMVVMLLKSKNPAPQVAANTPAADKKDDTGSAEATKPDDKGSAAATDTAAKPEGSAAQVAENDHPAPTETKTEPEKKETPAPAHHTESHTASHGGVAPSHTESHTVAKTEAKTPAAPADTGGGGCDEVSCVLNNYDGACCAKFKKKGGGGGGGGGGGSHNSDLPDQLDRSMISNAVGAVKARVSACGDRSPAKGKVKVHVKVGGDGRVSNVSVESSPDAALGACVQAAMQRATFPKTQSGGSFSYPFVF